MSHLCPIFRIWASVKMVLKNVGTLKLCVWSDGWWQIYWLWPLVGDILWPCMWLPTFRRSIPCIASFSPEYRGGTFLPKVGRYLPAVLHGVAGQRTKNLNLSYPYLLTGYKLLSKQKLAVTLVRINRVLLLFHKGRRVWTRLSAFFSTSIFGKGFGYGRIYWRYVRTIAFSL
jgi:hypothetical protein